MKLLIFSQHFWPEAFRINEVARALADAGVEVRVLTGKPNYPDGAIFPGYRAGGDLTEDWGGIPVHRVPLVPRGAGGGARLAANYLSFIASAALEGPGLLGGWRPDIVFVYGTSPILQAIAAARIARLTGARLVTWVQDLWPESLSATGFVTNRAALGAVARAVRWVYARSDLILAQSDAFVAPIRALAGDRPIVVHPNPAEAMAAPAGEPALRLAPGFNIMFAGNLGAAQGLEAVLGAAERLRGEPALRFVIVGSGRLLEPLRGEVARRGLMNVELPGRFPPEAMPGLYAQADALLATLSRQPILSFVVPSKIQSYLAAGRPILAAMDGEGARVVLEAGAGLASPAEDGAALAGAALTLHRLPSCEREAMGRRGRAYHALHYDPAILTPRLIGHFRSVLGDGRG